MFTPLNPGQFPFYLINSNSFANSFALDYKQFNCYATIKEESASPFKTLVALLYSEDNITWDYADKTKNISQEASQESDGNYKNEISFSYKLLEGKKFYKIIQINAAKDDPDNLFEDFPDDPNEIVNSSSISDHDDYRIIDLKDFTGLGVESDGSIKEIDELQNQIKELQIDKNQLQTQLDETIVEKTQLQTDLTNANNKITQLEADKTQLQTDLDTTNNDKVQLQTDLDTANDEITILENRISELNAKISELENKNSDLEYELEQIKTQGSDKDEELENLKIENEKQRQQITILQEQIKNSSGSTSNLAEQLARAKEELNELNNDVLVRIQKIEDKLNSTTINSNNNTNEIRKMQDSLVADINASLGTPRFGIMPLPIAKQAEAVNFELLEDVNSGHLYIKNGNRLVSKTVENEEKITDLTEFVESSWVGISINAENYESFITEDNDHIYANADETFSTDNTIMSFNKLQMFYDPLLEYLIGIRTKSGSVKSVYFVDEIGNKYNCDLVGQNGNDFIYKLKTRDINVIKIYPVIEFNSGNIIVKNISIFKDKSSIITSINSNNNSDSFGGTKIDPTLIDSNTIVNPDGTFKLMKGHDILVKIPLGALVEGTYTLILRTRNNTSESVTVKTVFDNNLVDNKSVSFSEAAYKAGGKTTYCDLVVPNYKTNNNYIRISTNNSSGITIEYFLIKIVDINIFNYYTRAQVDKKDIIFCGKTTNSGNKYTVNSKLITSMYDGLAVRATINANSNGNCYLQVNNLGYYPIIDSKLKNVKDLKADTQCQFGFNLSKRNFTLLGKGGDGIPEEGVPIEQTSMYNSYESTCILEGIRDDYNNNTVDTIIYINDSIAYVLSKRRHNSRSRSSLTYKLIEINLSLSKIYSLVSGSEVSIGYESNTNILEIAKRYIIVTSHKMSKDYSDDNAVDIIDTKEEKHGASLLINSYGSISIIYDALSYDNSYIKFEANKSKRYENYDVLLFDLQTGRISEEFHLNTHYPSIFYIMEIDNNKYYMYQDRTGDDKLVYIKKYDTDKEIIKMEKDWDNITQCGPDKFYIYKDNNIYYAQSQIVNNTFSFKILKTLRSYPAGSFQRKTESIITFSNGNNRTDFDMNGNVIKDYVDKYTFTNGYTENYRYKTKRIETSEKNVYQIIRQPNLIKPR